MTERSLGSLFDEGNYMLQQLGIVLGGLLLLAVVVSTATYPIWHPLFLDGKILREVGNRYTDDEIEDQVLQVHLYDGCQIEWWLDAWKVSIASEHTELPGFMTIIRKRLYADANPVHIPMEAGDNAAYDNEVFLKTTDTERLTLLLLNRKFPQGIKMN